MKIGKLGTVTTAGEMVSTIQMCPRADRRPSAQCSFFLSFHQNAVHSKCPVMTGFRSKRSGSHACSKSKWPCHQRTGQGMKPSSTLSQVCSLSQCLWMARSLSKMTWQEVVTKLDNHNIYIYIFIFIFIYIYIQYLYIYIIILMECVVSNKFQICFSTLQWKTGHLTFDPLTPHVGSPVAVPASTSQRRGGLKVAALKVPLGKWMVMEKKSMAMTQEPICWRYLPYIYIYILYIHI